MHACFALLLLLLLQLTPAFAVQPGEMLKDPALEARARALSQQLRCMVCQNQSIDDSDAPLAHDLRVLVRERLTHGDGDAQDDGYIHVDWGPQFAAQRGIGPAAFGEPGLLVGLGPLGLNYILRVGGMGYFRMGAAKPYLESNQLQLVDDAPQFTYPAYAVYPESTEARADVQKALRGLKEVAH